MIAQVVHGGGGPLRLPQACLDSFQLFGLVPKEIREVLRALGLVARQAGGDQIRNPVAAAFDFGNDVVFGQRLVSPSAVGATVTLLVEEVFPEFPAFQRSLLIFDPGNFRVLELLDIEFDRFNDPLGDGRPPAEFGEPVEGVVGHTSQGRRDSVVFPPAVVKAGGAAPKVCRAAPPAVLTPLKHFFVDFGFVVLYFGEEEGFGSVLGGCNKGDARGVGSWVGFECDGLGCSGGSVFEPDHEGQESCDHRSSFPA
jgi:hypothetical protein